MRLAEALKEQGRATSQHGVAMLLGMSQGSVSRWYHGEGLPQLATCRRLAVLGRVSVDWLITARKPKYQISEDPLLSRILEICIDLDDQGRRSVLRAAHRERIARKTKG